MDFMVFVVITKINKFKSWTDLKNCPGYQGMFIISSSGNLTADAAQTEGLLYLKIYI